MSRAAFVLAGGRSSRMGRDKALLPWAGTTLLGHVAQCAREAVQNITIIGSPERYSGLGFPVAADLEPDLGPLGGLYTALCLTSSEWNLLLACDMPNITTALMESLLDAAESAGKDCLVPRTARGIEPLCAVYHTRVLPAVQFAIHHKFLGMQDFVSGLDGCPWTGAGPQAFVNVNTPEQWVSAR